MICTRVGGVSEMLRSPVFSESTTVQRPEHSYLTTGINKYMDVVFPPAFFKLKCTLLHTLTEINLSNPSPSIIPSLSPCRGRDQSCLLRLWFCYSVRGEGTARGAHTPEDAGTIYCITGHKSWEGP